MVRISKMKKLIPPGVEVPITSKHVGNEVGIWAENTLESMGYPIQRGKGSDLPGVETKTRRTGTTSSLTIGRTTTDEIINTPWDASTLKEKCQQIAITKWDENVGVTVGNDIIDLRDDDAQSRLRDSYENARKKIANGETKNTGVDGDVYFEKKGKNSWQMRATTGGLKRMRDRAGSRDIKNNKEIFPDA